MTTEDAQIAQLAQELNDDHLAKKRASRAKPKTEPEGDGGALEEQHTTAIDRMENMATEAELDVKFLVNDARDFMLDQIKVRPKPWSATSQAEQRDVAAACEHAATELVRKVVEALRSEDVAPIRAVLESYSEKDGIKATLKVKTYSDDEGLAAVVGLHKAQGKMVLVTVASVDDYRGDRAAETDPDEPGLGFESGSDEFGEDE